MEAFTVGTAHQKVPIAHLVGCGRNDDQDQEIARCDRARYTLPGGDQKAKGAVGKALIRKGTYAYGYRTGRTVP